MSECKGVFCLVLFCFSFSLSPLMKRSCDLTVNAKKTGTKIQPVFLIKTPKGRDSEHIFQHTKDYTTILQPSHTNGEKN